MHRKGTKSNLLYRYIRRQKYVLRTFIQSSSRIQNGYMYLCYRSYLYLQELSMALDTCIHVGIRQFPAKLIIQAAFLSQLSPEDSLPQRKKLRLAPSCRFKLLGSYVCLLCHYMCERTRLSVCVCVCVYLRV